MLIGVDWGTTRLRAALIAPDGAIAAETSSDEGMMRARESGFSAALHRALAALGPDAAACPVLMAGMVGARQGWVEAPYVPTPVGLEALAAALVPVPGEPRVKIVPGVSHNAGTPRRADVMRGEETEVMGALALTGRTSGVFLLPGTHAKWVTVAAGTITGFTTYLTGDAFAALSKHTILSATMGVPSEADAFAAGVDLAQAATGGGDLLRDLFTLRTEWLFGRWGEDGVASALSGLLIGSECRAHLAAHGAGEVCLVGAGPLQDAYAAALTQLGRAPERVPSAAMVGLAALAARV